MKDRKVKLNGTAIAGQTLHNRPRVPNVILGDDAGYIRGDILDANAVQTKILELIGGAPEILDTLKELADALDDDPNIIKTLKTWYNNIKGITVSHINHNSTARADDHPSFTATATQAALNYDCFNLTSGNNTNHAGVDPDTGDLLGAILPIATWDSIENTGTAGIITAENAKKLDNIGTYTHLYHPGNSGGRTQTWWADANNVYLLYYCMNPASGSDKEHIHGDSQTSPMPIASSTLAGIITASDYNKFENKMLIETASSALSIEVGTYYHFPSAIDTLALTLPTVTDTTKVSSIIFYMTTGTSPSVTFTSSHPVLYQEGFSLDANETYLINCLFNGVAWVLMAAKISSGV